MTAYWQQPKDAAEQSYGHKDKELALLEFIELGQVIENGMPNLDFSALNVGAGNTNLFGLFIRHGRWLHCDRTPKCPDVKYGDIRKLSFYDKSFDLVLAKRVFCCLPEVEQRQAFKECMRVLKPGGRFLLMDVADGARRELLLARQEAGLPLLPAPVHNYQLRVSDILSWEADCEFTRAPSVPIAADYLIWTRLGMPMLTGKDDPFKLAALRGVYPQYSDQARDRFGYHRLWIFTRKS